MQRTPPGSTNKQLNTPSVATHYNSDSALNKTSDVTLDENYFNVTKRQKRTSQDLPTQTLPSADEIKGMFFDIKEQQEHKFELLNNALITIMSQNSEIQKSIATLTVQNEVLQKEVKELKQDNSAFKLRINALENKLEIEERKSCNSTIEIRNVPKIANTNKKDLMDIVQNVGEAISFKPPIQEVEIRDIYQSKTEVIVVAFSSSIRKEAFVSQYKAYNKAKREKKEPQLQSDQIKISCPPRPIYVSEHLTSKMRHIFFLARENVRNKLLVAAWTAYGRVYVKKEDGAAPIRILEEQQLHDLSL